MANIHLMIVITGEKEDVAEARFEEIVSEVFPELMKNTNSPYSRGPVNLLPGIVCRRSWFCFHY